MTRPAGALLALGVVVWLVLCARVGPPTGDFANYWTAAALWWEGDDLSRVYDYRWFTAQAARIGFEDRLVGFAVLTPPSALLLAPLVALALSPAQGALAWWLTQSVLGLLLACLLAAGRRWPLWLGVAALLLCWPVLRSNLIQGQLHLPVAVFLAGGLWAWRQRRDALAGALLGLAVGLKVHAWPVLLVALLARRWQTAAAAAATLALGGTVSVALLGWPVHAIWLSEIAPAAASGWFVHPFHLAFQSITAGLRHTWLPHPGLNPHPLGHHPQLVASLLAGFQPLVVGLTAASALSWPTLTGPQRDRVLAAAACAAMVSGPILSTYHLVLLLPVVCWAAGALADDGRRPHAAAVTIVAVLAAWVPAPSALVALPRLWLALLLWGLILPWRLDRRVWLGRVAAALLALGLAATAAPAGPDPDGAVPLDAPGFPLISAELTRTEDGSLWWSGLPTDRQGHPGVGWVGYRLSPGQPTPEIVAWDDSAHTWAPAATAADTVSWQRGPIDPVARARPGPGGGTLHAIDGDVVWHGPSGEERLLTAGVAHDSDPVWDPVGGRIWFLSDRGAGVRALRLWSIPDVVGRD